MLEGLRAGQILLADRAYDSNALRDAMTARGAWANVKPISRRIDPSTFSPFLYRNRNLVERFFNKLKHYRAIATRYEKRAANYLALVKLAAIRVRAAFAFAYATFSRQRMDPAHKESEARLLETQTGVNAAA